jgi:hypothetical protein
MRRPLPSLLALLLGVGAALLAACGASTRGGVPAADASTITSQLESVRTRVADGTCDGLATQLRRVNTAIDSLPRSVDNRLVSALRDGAERLQTAAIRECNANSVPTTTTTAPAETTTTQTQPQTQTQPTETTTTPADTTTVPPDTVTTPPPPPTATVAPVPPAEPPPPGIGPGGGTPPQIP